VKAIFPVALGEQTADGKFSQTFFEELRDGKVSWPASDGYPDTPGSYPAGEGRLPEVVSARSAAKAREFLGLLEPPVELSEEPTVKAAVDEVLTYQAMLVHFENDSIDALDGLQLVRVSSTHGARAKAIAMKHLAQVCAERVAKMVRALQAADTRLPEPEPELEPALDPWAERETLLEPEPEKPVVLQAAVASVVAYGPREEAHLRHLTQGRFDQQGPRAQPEPELEPEPEAKPAEQSGSDYEADASPTCRRRRSSTEIEDLEDDLIARFRRLSSESVECPDDVSDLVELGAALTRVESLRIQRRNSQDDVNPSPREQQAQVEEEEDSSESEAEEDTFARTVSAGRQKLAADKRRPHRSSYVGFAGGDIDIERAVLEVPQGDEELEPELEPEYNLQICESGEWASEGHRCVVRAADLSQLKFRLAQQLGLTGLVLEIFDDDFDEWCSPMGLEDVGPSPRVRIKAEGVAPEPSQPVAGVLAAEQEVHRKMKQDAARQKREAVDMERYRVELAEAARAAELAEARRRAGAADALPAEEEQVRQAAVERLWREAAEARAAAKVRHREAVHACLVALPVRPPSASTA
jgi:hypothetical protein